MIILEDILIIFFVGKIDINLISLFSLSFEIIKAFQRLSPINLIYLYFEKCAFSRENVMLEKIDFEEYKEHIGS